MIGMNGMNGMVSGAFVIVLALSSGITGCGGETAASEASSETDSEKTDGGDGTYVLGSDTEPCDGAETMTIEGVRSKLPAPATYEYTLTYEDGRTTEATLTLRPYDPVVRCAPKPSGPIAPSVQVRFTTKADVVTGDGAVVGTFAMAVSVIGRSADRTSLSWSATAEVAELTGTLRPTIEQTGYDKHKVALGPASPGDQDLVDDGMEKLSMSEVAYTENPYSQVGAPIGTLTLR